MADFLIDEGKNKIEGLPKTAINEALQALNTALSGKADATAVNEALQALNTALSGKADATAVNEALQAINTALNGKANVNDVYSKIQIDNIEIEGFQRSQYQNITSESILTTNKYAEMVGGYIQISNSSNYKYAVIDVVEGKTYQTTGVNVFDMRPMIFTDNNGKILFYLPTQRKTTAEYVTVEAVAPIGATKLYVNGRTNDEIIIKEKGIFYVSTEEKNTGINIEINKNNVLDTTITTYIGGTIRQKIEVYNNEGQPNNAVLPSVVDINIDNAWKTIVNNEDDDAPVQLMSGYIGAGHGYNRARKITLNSHGKTFADIGSKWELNSSTPRFWYIVRIIDDNNLVMLGENQAGSAYDTVPVAVGDTFTHIEGAVNTETMIGFTSAAYAIAPIDKNHVKKVMLDGIIEASENGNYTANDHVDIVEEYDIVNPQSIVTEILNNKPIGGYTENPIVNTGDAFLHFSNIYRILNDGTMLLFSLLDNDVLIDLSYWSGTQYAQKASASVFGGGVFRYVPKLLEVDGHDLRIPFNLSSWNFTIEAIKTNWEDADNPPDRLLHLYTNNDGTFKAGYAVGYLPIAYGKASERKTNVGNAMTLYNTKKTYPHIVDRNGLSGGNWNAYTPFQCVVYRKPVLDVADIHTDVYFIPYGDKCYLYADYHAISDDRIKIPSEYVGKPITVIEKSSNVTVYGTIATDEIRIRVDTATPMYGYAVIQIG